MRMHQVPISNLQSPARNHHAPRTTPHALYLALFLFLFSIYLLTYTPRINSSDGLAMFSTAESLIRRGAPDIEQIRWMDLQQGSYGLDGLLYSRKGIGVPIGLLPLTWLGLVVPWWGTVGASLLFNAIVTALTAVGLLAYLGELGYSQRTGLMVALVFGLTTLAWPYAKSLFSDPFSGLLLLSAALALLKFSRGAEERGSRGDKNCSPAPLLLRPTALFYCFLAGLGLGWNVAARYAEAIFVPVFGLLLLYYLFNTKPLTIYDLGFRIYDLGFRFARLRRICDLPAFDQALRFTLYALPPILAFTTPILLIGLALISFNISRYGDLFNTGYLPNETFSGVLWQGLLGQLISPGRGLLLYCPILWLSLVGLPGFFRRHPAQTVVAVSVILIHLLMYGKWFMWHGGYAWGPRFIVPTLPFWAILLAPIVEKLWTDTPPSTPIRWAVHLPFSILQAAFLILAALSLAAQLLSVAIDFAPFQNSLLDTGLPLFDPQTFFDLQYSPFLAAWRFVTTESLDLAWAWQGQFQGALLALLVLNMGLTGLNLRMANDLPSYSVIRSTLAFITPFFTLTTAALLLSHTHTLPPPSLQQAVSALNEAVQPTDAVITNNPDLTMPFAELYKGRATVLGLQSGSFPLPGPVAQRLNQIIGQHQQVWWLPGGVPPEQSAVEQMLLQAGFQARHEAWGEQRLVLFTIRPDLSSYTTQVGANFAEQIRLLTSSYPPETPAGAALPIELRWQALAKLSQDYHVFIHLVGEDGALVAQADGQPVLWSRPTTTWNLGETITDRYGLWVPPGTRPGGYQLRVGLYQPGNGQRVPLTTGEDAVKFNITVY
jgi:hypothetical protein